MSGETPARAALLALAERVGWPAVKTRRGDVAAGESAWRSFVAGAGYFSMGAAEDALRARGEGTAQEGARA